MLIVFRSKMNEITFLQSQYSSVKICKWWIQRCYQAVYASPNIEQEVRMDSSLIGFSSSRPNEDCVTHAPLACPFSLIWEQKNQQLILDSDRDKGGAVRFWGNLKSCCIPNWPWFGPLHHGSSSCQSFKRLESCFKRLIGLASADSQFLYLLLGRKRR